MEQPKSERVKLQHSLIEGQSDDVAASLFNAGEIVLERYLVIKLLGIGGMGSVYQVRDLNSRLEYAMKCLNRHHTNDTVWRRFDNEARAAGRLDHPNLIKVHDSGLLPDGQPYFVMDYVHGVTLADELKEQTRLPIERTLKIMIQVAFAMAYAHDNGVVHRDIKPSNIMIGNDKEIAEGNVKLVDFGIAKLTGQDTYNQLTLTRTGEIFGSPLYMSPEQCAGIATDHRSDLYSFGCVMYETLTGAPPILADNALSTMIKHQTEQPVPLKQASLGVTFPDASELIVSKLLEKDPAQRYQSAHELLKDLVSLEQYLISGTSEPAVVQRSATRSKLPQAIQPSSAWYRVSAPMAVLLLVSGFGLGILASQLSGVLNRTASGVRTKTDEPTPSQLSLAERPIILEKPRQFATDPDNDFFDKRMQYFSNKGGLQRLFRFPTQSLGKIIMPGGKSAEASVFIDFPSGFMPVHLVASDYLYSHPTLMNKFRSDELAEVELKNCDENLDELLEGLVRQKWLTSLSLASSSASDESLPIIDKMQALLSLDLFGARLSGEKVANMKILNHLVKLQVSQLSGPKPLIHALKKLPLLRSLEISRTNLDAADVIEISKIKTISHLDFTDDAALNDKTISYIANLPDLSYLDIERCPVTAAALPQFKKMRNMKHLHLSIAGWSESQRKELERVMPTNCQTDWCQTDARTLIPEEIKGPLPSL